MIRHFFFFLTMLSIQSCTVYSVINKTDEDKKVTLRIESSKLKNTQYYAELIEAVRNIQILNKSIEHNESTYLMCYEIKVAPENSLKLNKLIHIYMLSYKSYKASEDFLNLSLNPGQPILILADSVIVNKFRRVFFYPWFRYEIKD